MKTSAAKRGREERRIMRKPIGKTVTIIGLVVLLVLIIAGIGSWLGTDGKGGFGGPGSNEGSGKPGREASPNPPGCVDYEVVALPGTWESKADDDPVHPTANPRSLLLHVTQPLQEQTNPERVKIHTVPYTAQFRNFNAQHERSEEHTSELQSRFDLVCRLLLEKKKNTYQIVGQTPSIQ